MAARIARIAEIRENIKARYIETTVSRRYEDKAAIRGWNAITHRDTLNHHPEVAAYWSAKR